MPPTLPPPFCAQCGSTLNVATDTFKSGKWKQRCARCLLPARTYQRNHALRTCAPPPTKRIALAESPSHSNAATLPLNPLSSLLRTPTPLPPSTPRLNCPSSLQFPTVPFTPWSVTATSRSSSPCSTAPRLYTASFRPQEAQSSSWGTTSEFSSQVEEDENEDEFGISPGISLEDLRRAEDAAYELPSSPLPLDLDDPECLDRQAISESDKALVTRFYREVDKVQLQTCNVCNRSWFDLDVYNDECMDCLQDRTKHGNMPGFVPLFGNANDLDPGPMPPSLPTLTPIEEMLLARVHCFMEVRQHRGMQYKYRGHICNFAVNTGKVFNRLPLVPQDLDIIILKPPQSEGDDPEAMTRQFQKDYKVRRAVVVQWLHYLIAHHSGYSDIIINETAIASLPVDDFVDNQLTTIIHDPNNVASTQRTASDEPAAPLVSGGLPPQPLFSGNSTGNSNYYGDSIWENSDDEEDLMPECVAVPDVAADVTEFEALREQIQSRALDTFLSMGSVRRTPIAEFNTSEACLSLAFPSLYPTGRAEFVAPRLREISYASYVKLMLCYRDGRFARHPRFRYATFNTLLRRQSNDKAGFFVKRHAGSEDMTVEDIQAAFNSDHNGQQLLDTIVRWSAALRGTRAYWASEGKKLESMVSISLFVFVSSHSLCIYDQTNST